MKNSNKKEVGQLPIEMDFDKVYKIGDLEIIISRRIITSGEHQAEMLIYSPEHKETKKQELIGKMYPRFKDAETGYKYEGFLPAYSIIVEMHIKERFDMLVAKIEADKAND